MREEAVAKKDVRGQEIAHEKQERARVVVPEEDTPYSLEKEDWVRTFVIKMWGVFEQLGIIRYTNDTITFSDNDSDEVVNNPSEEKASKS